MAASISGDEKHLVTCGDCLESEGYILNPMHLPCSHSFCETCLRSHLKKSNVFKCKVCDQKTTVDIDNLPSALKDVKPTFCEACEKKGKHKMTANTYCVQCERKFCAAHEELHQETVGPHECLDIKEYLKSSHSAEQKFCEKHKDKVLCMGCASCMKVLCPQCISSFTDSSCNNGSSHKLMPIEELEQEVKGMFEPQKKIVEDKFDEWSAVMKEASITLTNWDTETEEGLDLINATEEKQLDGIKEKYARLRDEYRAKREEAKEKLTDYMEKDAGVMVSEFHEKLKEFRKNVSNKHCVDLLKAKAELQNQLYEMEEIEFSQLVMTGQKALEVDKAARTDLNIALVPSEDFVMGFNLHRNIKPPTSMHFVKQLSMGTWIHTVCSYRHFIYAGLGNKTVRRYDGADNQTANFIKLTNYPITIRAYKDRIYILMHGQPYKILVYDLNGQQITSWDHTYMNGYRIGNKLCFSKDQILVPDKTNQRISVYNLDGTVVRQAPCPHMPTGTYLSMSIAGDDSVIITTHTPPAVFSFDLRTSTVLWRTELAGNPFSSAVYGNVVLVSGCGYNNKRGVWIEVLNRKTGEKLREFKDRAGVQTRVFDLFTDKEMLLVPSFHESSVLFYKLEHK